MKAKKSTAPKPSLVVVPKPAKKPLPGKQTALLTKVSKKPLDPREFPAARDARGTASRTEIRREAPRVSVPRSTSRPAERKNQPRSHKAGKK